MSVPQFQRTCLDCAWVITGPRQEAPCPRCDGPCTVGVPYAPPPIVNPGPKADHPWWNPPAQCACEWCIKVRLPGRFAADAEWALENL